MAIRTRKNLYSGVNAHLHSQLQHESGAWEVFHSVHICDIARAIDAVLPPGYIAEPERGLQIRGFQSGDDEQVIFKLWRPRLDVTIYETDSQSGSRQAVSSVASSMPTYEYPALAGLEYGEEVHLSAVAIREITDSSSIGRTITWVELLSPTNKPPGVGFIQYREKRVAALQGGIALVEIDYLHETRSPISNHLSYPDGEKGATPYNITVTNPRPNLQTGRMKVYGFQVDESIRTVEIPLKGEEQIIINFQEIYDRTFESLNAFSYRVDYDKVPTSLDSYHSDDQKRILAVMERTRILSQEEANR
jgi:Protein of unknown function (DUF4058)